MVKSIQPPQMKNKDGLTDRLQDQWPRAFLYSSEYAIADVGNKKVKVTKLYAIEMF